MLISLIGFVAGLCRGIELIALGLVIGGLFWIAAILRPWRDPTLTAAAERSGRLIAAGAMVLLAAVLFEMLARPILLADVLGTYPVGVYLQTLTFRAGFVHALLVAVLVVATRRLPCTKRRTVLQTSAVATAVVVAGAWLTHAAGRVEDRDLLMALTTVHEVVAVIWVGAVVHIAATWHLGRGIASVAAAWPARLAEFSPWGFAIVAVLIATGVFMARAYIGSWDGLIGTAYGSLLISKLLLMTVVLALAAYNLASGRRWRLRGGGHPYVVETEAILLAVIVFAAAALSSLPPAVDIVDERATLAEVWHTFAPKRPQLDSPTLAQELAASDRSAATVRTSESDEERWSNFNHNVAGIILLVTALTALIGRTGYAPWARHWPLGMLALAVFVFCRDPEMWPLGNVGLIEAMHDPENLQHTIAAGLVATLAITEWRVRTATRISAWLPYLFPVLSVAGGLLLLGHSHSSFELRIEYLVQVSHTLMGVLAALLAAGRWLELRMPDRLGHAAGTAADFAMLLLALVLVFYREPVA